MNYEEQQRLRHRIRQLKDAVDGLNRRLEYANDILQKHKLGPYKYTTSPEEEWEKRIENISARLRMQGEFAAERIRNVFCEHEVIIYEYGDDKSMKLTSGKLFEQLKKQQEDSNDKNICTRDGPTNI